MSEAKPIIPKTTPKYHWWYDSRAAGVRNPPPANYTGSPPSPSPLDSPPKRRFSFSLASFYTPSSDALEGIYDNTRKPSFSE